MKLFVKNKFTGVWHWCPECPDFPRGRNKGSSTKKPLNGAYCMLCTQIEVLILNRQRRSTMLEEDIFF